jgi:acetoin utilization deacetylase AcuC-like enzyme
MNATRSVAVVEDPRYRQHRSPPGHPEHPERLSAVAQAVSAREERVLRLATRAASEEEILSVHRRDHLARIGEAVRRAPTHLDPDTYLSPQSLEVAELAAGGTVEAARAVAAGSVPAAFAAVRPPGHHAEAARAMGFCLFNNVAIAARALQRWDGVEKLLIIDWDVHHGNGTQHLFEDDASVLYFSTHQYPFYPGTGDAGEVGRDRGEGATVNVPLPAGCGDEEYVGVFRRLLVPVGEQFGPQMILVSCGFDAHREDPLASMQVSGEGFREMARIVRALAERCCEGRVALVLEGGYSPAGLCEGTAAVLDALLEPEPAQLAPLPTLRPASALARVVDRVASAHRRAYPGLGAI